MFIFRNIWGFFCIVLKLMLIILLYLSIDVLVVLDIINN